MTSKKHLPLYEFVVLMAMLTSVTPLAIDGMLPAFPDIGHALNVGSSDQLQLIVAILFLGFGFGQLFFGPLSDAFGRKPPIYFGIVVFMVGAILSGVAETYEAFLFGRFLQGFGGASPRIISLALIRDEYAGDAMAKITSLVMTIFILVPAVAPALGQGILMFAGWRQIFILLFVMALLVFLWFALRQHETLPKERRKKFNLPTIVHGVKETFSQSTTVVCMVVSGLVFGIFVAYLGSVQGIFLNLFQIKEQFPMYFAMLSLSIGLASFFNSRLVMKYGMRRIIFLAFLAMAILSNLFVLYLYVADVHTPPLWQFMLYLSPMFFFVGFLFGNLNALAMKPLGHVAGIGSAILGCVQSTVSVAVGIPLGHYFHDSVIPLVLSFATISLISLLIFGVEQRFQR